MYEQLKAIKATVELADLDASAVKELQTILKRVKLYNGATDGIVGENTISALAAFKKSEYLAFPTQLGETTVETLLEAVEPREAPQDSPMVVTSAKVVNIPGVSRIWANKPIYDNCAFTWGEATKGLTRLPANTQVTDNIIKVAKKLQELRDYFDRPITINSWYRPPAVNASVGGARNSRHIQGDGVDLVVSGIAPKVAVKSIKKLMGNDGGVGDSSIFTHIDMRGYAAFWNYGR